VDNNVAAASRIIEGTMVLECYPGKTTSGATETDDWMSGDYRGAQGSERRDDGRKQELGEVVPEIESEYPH
jgi:hypothetical protein